MNIAIHNQVSQAIVTRYADNGHAVRVLTADMTNEQFYQTVKNCDRLVIAYNAWNELLLGASSLCEIHWIEPPAELMAKLTSFTKEYLNMHMFSNTDNYIMRTFLV